ncbi:MAG: GNAT family N-acetyltransferase [Allosphingosinicella sp.]
MRYAIRTAAPADVAAMHHIRRSARENRLSDPRRVVESSYLPFIAGGSAWVAETEGGIAGFAVIDVAAGNIWALFVSPDAEGTGVGGALHEHMLGWAQALGLRHLWLTTAPETRAERLYAERGWKRTGVTADGEVRFEWILTD